MGQWYRISVSPLDSGNGSGFRSSFWCGFTLLTHPARVSGCGSGRGGDGFLMGGESGVQLGSCFHCWVSPSNKLSASKISPSSGASCLMSTNDERERKHSWVGSVRFKHGGQYVTHYSHSSGSDFLSSPKMSLFHGFLLLLTFHRERTVSLHNPLPKLNLRSFFLWTDHHVSKGFKLLLRIGRTLAFSHSSRSEKAVSLKYPSRVRWWMFPI